MPTPATGLGGVTRINLGHGDSFLLCFVGEKGVKLGKAPRMEATLCFCLFLHPSTRTNMRQVLNDNGRTDMAGGNDLLTENMVDPTPI